MVDVVEVAVGSTAHRDDLSVRKSALFRPELCVKDAEHVVVGAIFFHDEDDVIDLWNAGRSLLLGTTWNDCGKKEKNAESGATARAQHEVLLQCCGGGNGASRRAGSQGRDSALGGKSTPAYATALNDIK